MTETQHSIQFEFISHKSDRMKVHTNFEVTKDTELKVKRIRGVEGTYRSERYTLTVIKGEMFGWHNIQLDILTLLEEP